jgi:iron complex transport system substrate-binding protein
MKAFSAFSILIFCLFLLPCSFAGPSNNIKLTDLAERKVTVPANVERIVAITGTLRFVVYLNGFDNVVGIEEMEQRYPATVFRPYSLIAKAKANRLPVIGEGGPGKLHDLERLIGVRPDVIFTTDSSMADTVQQRTGIPVIVVSYGNSDILDKKDFISSLNLMGRLLRKEDRAKEIDNFINDFERDILKRIKGIPEEQRGRVYIGAIGYYGSHGITSTMVSYPPFEWLGARNVANEVGKSGSFFVDKEKIIHWNPDVIFVDAGGFTLVQNDFMKNRKFYLNLRAAKESRMYTTLPYNYYFTNIEVAIANTYVIGKIIYPSRFQDIDPMKKTGEIFKFFLGMDAANELREEPYGYGKVVFDKDKLKIEKMP